MAELAKGFPAFGPRKRRTRRAATWWGNAWIDALEDSSLDSDALRRGRAFAHGGHVGTITVSPGRISATVYGEDHVPHETVVALRTFADQSWDRLLEAVAANAGQVAALLDRDLPYDVAETASDVSVPLLPEMDELEPRCTCDDWGHPCTHAAALCYQASWLLDSDPFLLLLLRGRGDDEILAELQRRNASGGSAADGTTGLDPGTIEQVIADAAARAEELLAKSRPYR